MGNRSDLFRKAVSCWKWLKAVIVTFDSSRCSMHAAGLTYYALLAIIPILCVLLTGAKAVGADHLAKDKIHEIFESQISKFEVDSGLKADPVEDAAAAAAEQPAAEGQVAAEEQPAEEGQAAAAAENQDPPPVETKTAPSPVESQTPAEADAASKLAATQTFIQQARRTVYGLLEKVEQFDVHTLGWVGFGMLVWTVISSIGMMELSFNEIWDVPKQRPIWKRAFLDLLVATVLPVLGTLALTGPLLKLVKDVIMRTAGSISLTKWFSDGAVWLLDLWILRVGVTFFFTALVFAFLFKVMPNCHVKTRPAVWTGFATSLAFGAWLKLCAVAQVGIAKTSALYGSFAFLPIVLAWLFMSWQIVLLGCCVVKVASQPPEAR